MSRIIARIVALTFLGLFIAVGLLVLVGGPVSIAAEYYGSWWKGVAVYLASAVVLLLVIWVLVWAIETLEREENE